MRKAIAFIILLIVMFVVNIIFYIVSDDYKFFLKKIKEGDDIVYINDEINKDLLANDNLFEGELIETNKKNEEIFRKNKKTDSFELKKEISLGKNYTDILDLFSIYGLSKLEINSNLFDITDEYPDNYFEYYSRDLTLYLFPTKSYIDILDIFDILQTELPITINEVNNFGDKSFYVNLNKDIEDKFIRLIITNKGIVFGLKIKKSEYNLVKEKLNSLK